MSDNIQPAMPNERFDIGRVIGSTFEAIKNNFVSFFLAALIIMGLPTFVMSIAPVYTGIDVTMVPDDSTLGPYLILIGISFLVAIIGSIILQGALIYGAIADFNGEKASFGECISIALRYFFPLLGLAILVTLGIIFGSLLLVIPGILIALGWSIAAPVLIVERPGVFDSISRSWELTSGYKRWILLLWILMTIASMIIGGVFGFLSFALGDPTTMAMGGVSMTYLFVSAIFSALIQAISTMISAVGIAAVYYEIRYVKEGVGAESLAAVFD